MPQQAKLPFTVPKGEKMDWLSGVRVLDLSRLLPGPYCSLLLADLGAEVIKIEEPGRGDYVRWMPPLVGDVGAAFAALNRGKKSVAINLKSDKGKALFLRLVETADVVLETFRPGVAERLGLGYDALKTRRPSLVYCSISGYGQSGPYRVMAGHDVNYLAYAGVLGLSGPKEGPPILSGVQIADVAGGSYPAALGILGALFRRVRTGEGALLDISMTEGALALLGPLFAAHGGGDPLPERGNMPLSGGLPCYRVYRVKDGFLAVGALEPKFFERLCSAMGRPDLAATGLAQGITGEGTASELQKIFLQQTKEEWVEWLASADACVAPVLSLDEVLRDTHLGARGAFLDLVVEGVTLRVPASPIREVDGPRSFAGAVPGLGEHTHEFLGGLGVKQKELDRLTGQGVIAGV